MYDKRIPISDSKYLQELKSVIDNDFHVFYDTLSFKIVDKKRSHETNLENEGLLAVQRPKR